jgi:DNA-binding transcriptional LysR family regulator
LTDLPRFDVIGYDTETPALRAMASRLAPLDQERFALRTDSNVAQFAAIRAGVGLGICQVAVARRDPALVRILPEISVMLPLWIVMHEDLKTSARCRVVFDALVAGLSGLAG